ncbi:FUSC family protein [Microlunatus soli]|uniref:Aromatic acid exporter family member 1 n=1 Tax=Microlunatus soli TaxID=630515 RepID=A0A1H1Z7L1_9ACTN|nr:aromatic acid exporter family protein [Microlunatus soli]SDT29613.1 Aromatic acid exporter family member 1 [Microlunatus soli]
MLNSRLLGLIWPAHPTSWRDVPGRLLPFGVQMLRVTIAAVVAYLLTLPLAKGGPIDLTGPLTAMLVVQASAVGTFRMGLVRVGAVLSGVLIATLLSNWIGLTWWSLGAAIASALLLARVLRLREQLLEAPISAMLILGVTNHGVAAEIRVLNTFVGAGVGMAMGMLFPTALAAASVIGGLKRLAASMARPLDDAADTMRDQPPTRAQAQDWLDLARDTSGELAEVVRSVASLRERRRWNPRALGTTNAVPVLDSALDTYDRCLMALRALFTAIVGELPDGEEPEDRFGDELRQIFAVVLGQTAECLRAFGELVAAEADGREEHAEEALRQSLEYAGETRAMLAELMLVGPDARNAWLLRSSVIVALEHLLNELRLENRERARQARNKQRLPIVVEGVLPHPERPYPRAVDMVLDRRRMLRHRSRNR